MSAMELIKNMDFIVALACGAPAALPSNQATASRTEYLSMWGNFLPVITQRDIVIERSCIPIYYLDDGKRHFSILELAKRFRGLTPTKQGWRKGLMVAAPPILERAVRDFRRVGFDVEPDNYLAKMYPPDYWYRKESEQWWTRYRQIFEAREAVLKQLHWWFYEWIAG